MLALHGQTRALVSAAEDETVRRLETEVDFAYLAEEAPMAIAQSVDGIAQGLGIVRAMKVFSHQEPGRTQVPVDLRTAIEAVVTVARSETRDVADVALELGEVPPVRAFGGALNQVLLNLVVNAAHAVAEKATPTGQRGRTGYERRATTTTSSCPSRTRASASPPPFGTGSSSPSSRPRGSARDRGRGWLTRARSWSSGTAARSRSSPRWGVGPRSSCDCRSQDVLVDRYGAIFRYTASYSFARCFHEYCPRIPLRCSRFHRMRSAPLPLPHTPSARPSAHASPSVSK